MKRISSILVQSLGTGMIALGLLPTLLQAQVGFEGKRLPNTVNSEVDESVPRLTPDGNTLYFTRYQHPENVKGRGGGQDIWYSKREGANGWSQAVHLGAPLNNEHHNFVGAASENGQVLLGNTYGLQTSDTRPGISLSMPKGEGWVPPVTVVGAEAIPKGSRFIDFHSAVGGEVLIVSLLDENTGNEDLYFIKRTNESYGSPVFMGWEINTNGFEGTPFLTEDGRTLYFSSDGHDGMGGGDIFRSRRIGDGWTDWSEPENLGPRVNTPGFDGHFVVDEVHGQAFFVSGPSPSAAGDIYSIDLDALWPQPVADTLRISAQSGVPLPLYLRPYGVTADNAHLLTAQPMGGPGLIVPDDAGKGHVYRPSGSFVGVERIKLELCDPPHSDNCRKIIVVAEVSAGKPSVLPVYAMRTPKNTSVQLENVVPNLNLGETRRRYQARPGPDGELKLAASGNLEYLPARDYVGVDSMVLYGPCGKGEDSNCPKAIVVVNVYDQPSVVMVDPKPIETGTVVVAGTVRDEQTGKPVDATVTFYNASGSKVPLGMTKADPETGAYSIELPKNLDLIVESSHPFYLPLSEQISTGGKAAIKGKLAHDIALTPIPMEAGQTFTLRNIYFDLDKSTLKPESKEELTRLYNLLKNYPNMEIEVRGHTDSWASDDYNQRLSDARAAAVVNYLKYQGVMGYRLRSQGFGERVPVATNETVEGRALNRRVEFVIIKN